ncbi:MAG: hypothetical protein JWR67_2197 [Mucilaginibacter sp.]|nr:hypothetical protein [Mucilaginibacter sp.]
MEHSLRTFITHNELLTMHSTNFYTIKTNGQEVIRDHKTLLQIKIYALEEECFMPNNNEITLYGIGQNCKLAFETICIRDYNAELVAYALAWYVDYIGQHDMQITSEDPRMPFRLKRA